MKETLYAALEQGFTAPVRDPLWGHVYFTPALEAITRSGPFMRLHRILQLGPAHRVYPGATHTRASHSVGVYGLARRLLRSFAEQGADVWMSGTGARSFLAAALLHDAGHFPYAHSLKELPLERHEVLTGRLVLSEPLRSLVSAAGADPYLTAGIIDPNLPLGTETEAAFYRGLLSGVIDPDKMDYLNRDARYCGVPYGAQDVDFIFSRLRPHPLRGADIDSRAIPSVESVLFSKYLMYRAVYWHPSVRSATAMMKKAVLAGLASGAVAGEELYGLDDQGLFSLLKSRAAPLSGLLDRIRDGNLYTLAEEFPYDDSVHRDLLPVESRSVHEAAAAERFSRASGATVPPESVIIDIPEPVGFETGLYITDEGCYFARSSSVFKAGTVDLFTQSLRKVRIFTAGSPPAAGGT
ncbi:MAG: HD domain-containing protein [Spirochaetaceae bacterium]|jgi:HD superfamily phosphohydrolase|nr:HD domain-containing protein [Spirochaetaceae bacterium]